MKARTEITPHILPALDALTFSKLCIHETAPTDGTGKRKVDGSHADTRLGKALTPRWANERFRQVMMLVREFRTEWPNQSLLSNDDVEFIRMAVDMHSSRDDISNLIAPQREAAYKEEHKA